MITLVSEKGSPLTITEGDQNFSELDERTALGWRDLILALDIRDGPSAPPLLNFRNGIYLFAFGIVTENEAFGNAHIDHDYATGTPLYPHIHWTTNVASTGTVRWGIEYTVAKGHQQMSYGPSNTIYIEQASTGQQYMHYVAEVTPENVIPATNIEPDTVILMRMFRDITHPNDTFPADAFGICLDIHYQANRHTTPNKAPNFYA